MKRVLCIMLMLALLCALIPAGNAETELVEIRNDAGKYSIRVPEGTQYQVNGFSFELFLQQSSLPFISVDRRTDDYDPIDYLHNYWPQVMTETFGDDLAGVIRHDTYEIGGKTMPAVSFTFRYDGSIINEIRLWETRSDGNVEYLTRFRNSDRDTTLAALDGVVRYYQPDGADPTPVPGGKGTSEQLNIVQYKKDKRFSVLMPEGWKIITDLDYGDFCFKVYDPASPDRAYFLFMSMAPFLKSQAAKNYYTELSVYDQPTYPKFTLYAMAPVLVDTKLETFLKVVPETREYAGYFYRNYRYLGFGLNPDIFPQMRNANAYRTQGSFACVRAVNDAGQPVECLVTAVVQPGGYYTDALGRYDIAPRAVQNFTGITAPEGEMDALLPVLSQCLSSFAFSPDYVKESLTISEEVKKTLLAQGEYMQALHDAMVQSWLGY